MEIEKIHFVTGPGELRCMICNKRTATHRTRGVVRYPVCRICGDRLVRDENRQKENENE